MRSKGDAYAEYVRRTSGFFPWPPRLILQRHLAECVSASPVVALPGLVLASSAPV
jgi:hypothetical protein